MILAGVVIALSSYYLLWVRNQSGYFNDRNFRKLSLISSQIGSKLTSAGSVLEKTCGKFISPATADEQDYKFDAHASKKQNLDALKKAFDRLRDDSPQIIPFDIVVEKWGANTAGNVVLTDVRNEGGSSWLYFDYFADGVEAGTIIKVQAKMELNGLIQPFLSARIGSNPDQFQDILIAQADTARVILQYDTTQVRLASLDKLTTADGKSLNLKDVSQTSNAVDVSLAGSTYRLFSHPLKVSLPAAGAGAASTSWIITGLIKADVFKSVAWSLSIPYTPLIISGFIVAMLVFSGPFLKLVLAGPKDRFRTRDVYLLVFCTMIVLAVATAFALYGFVYTSVETEMDEQVKTLATNLKSNFNAELNSALVQLDTLSNNSNLLNRLVAEEELRKQGKTVSAGGIGALASSDQRKADAQKAATCAPEDKNIYSLPDTNKTGILPCVLSSCETSYPYFEMVAWIDKTGTQRAKWTTKDYTTQYVSVADRAYFQNIRRKHFYEVPGHKFWLEPIVSRSTGRNQVEISKQVKDTNWTIAFDTRLLSLMDPVLPDAFGYVIINNEGKVLFHSDEVHHLGENLLQECDDDRNLRSAVIGRADRALNVRYSGQDYRFFVTTLEGFPDWSLVVFRSKQPLRSAFFELLTSLTALFLIHVIILIVGFTVFFVIYDRNRRKLWLWPEKRKKESYVQLCYVMVVLTFVSLMLTLFLHGQWLVWASAGLAWLGALVFFVSLRYGPWFRARFAELRSRSARWVRPSLIEGELPAKESEPESTTVTAEVKEPSPSPSEADKPKPPPCAASPAVRPVDPPPPWYRRYDWIYALNQMLLVVLLAIVPMGAFFKYEYETQITLFIKHAQFSMATAIGRRDERIRAQYANDAALQPISCPTPLPNPETNILTRRLGETWDVYDQFFYGTARDKHRAEQTGSQKALSETDILSPLNSLLPVSSQSSLERHSLIDNESVMGICSWDTFAANILTLNLNEDGKQGWPWRTLRTSVPIMGLSWVPLVALVVLCIPLLLLINFMMRIVFLLDIHKPTSHSLKSFLCEKIHRNVFVVVDAPFFKKKRFTPESLHLQKFSELAAAPEWDGSFDENQCRSQSVIAFDQFEFQKDNPRTNEGRLKLLRKLVEDKSKSVILFSTVDPSEYNFVNGDANANDDHAGEWAELLIGNFFTEYAEDTDDRFDADKWSFKEKVDAQRDRLKEEAREQGQRPEDVKRLIDTLYTECAPRVPLQGGGLQILKTKDFVTLSKEHLLGRIVNQARPYYEHLWKSCSVGQKQTLCHLSQDRRLSHRDPDIQALLKRELIVRDEGLNLFNESFGKFVVGRKQLKDVAQEEQKVLEESWWQALKTPIVVILIFVAAFLFWTQQDIFSSSVAVVTGVTGLISAVIKMMSVFQGKGAKEA